MEHAKKLEKSKSQKSAKSQKLSKSEKSESEKLKKLSKSRNSLYFDTKENRLNFLILDTRETFNRLRLAFTKALIFYHFDLKCHIQIKTNISSYATDIVLNQLTSRTSSDEIIIKTNLDQWYQIVVFLKKIILAETRYKTHNNKFLAIVKAFKTQWYHLEGCKYKVFILIDHINFHCFIDTKSLSF